MGFSANLGKQGMVRSAIEEPAYFALGIVEIAEVHAVSWTDRHTCRQFALFHSMYAESTFGRITFRVNESGIIGTCGNTGFAAAAFIFVDKNNPTGF